MESRIMIRSWSIKKRLYILGILPILLMSISLMAYFLPILLDNAQQALIKKATLMAKQIVPASEYALLTNNIENLKPLINTQLNDNEVIAVTIRKLDGKKFFSSGKKGYKPEQGLSFIENVYQQKVNINDFETDDSSNENALIGTVEIIVTTQYLQQEKKDIIASSILITLITFVISMLIAVVNGESISNSIIHISEEVNKLNNGEYEIFIASKNGGELGSLENDINQLAKTLNESREFEKKQTQEILKAKTIAEHANNVKTEFLAHMSHELRTPMNGNLGMLQLLEQTQLTEEQREYVTTATHSMKHLLILVNELLDFSKFEQHKIQLDLQQFNLFEKLNEITHNFKITALKKNIQFVEVLDETRNWQVVTDSIKLTQILFNIIDNAIKFTSQGKVEFVATPIDYKNGIPSCLKVEITDTGIGIAEQKLSKIFDAFVQADSSTTREYGGTGLGLTISKDLVKFFNGSIDVESKPGIGTRFVICLPIKFVFHADNDENVTVNSQSLKFSGKVLVVEDDASNQLVIKTMLEIMGFKVDVADNGKQALTLCDQVHYQIIFMDCQMPILSGLDASRKILADSLKNNSTPIVGVTAGIYEHTEQRCLDAGMKAYLSKPIEKELLIKIIEKLIK